MESGTGDGSGSGFSGTDYYESLISTTDAELLKRAWRNEKASPEILRFEAALVQRSREQIQSMEETVEEFTKNGVEPLSVSLYQMDLDRTLFLLRSYLRTRLQKLLKAKPYDHECEKQIDRKLRNMFFTFKKLLNFGIGCLNKNKSLPKEDMEQHFEESVLSKLPDRYKSHLKQSVINEEDDMVGWRSQ